MIADTQMTRITQMGRGQELLYKGLSYKIIGALYKVYNTLGFGYKEKEYQKAIVSELISMGIPFKRELYCPITYNGRVLTKFFVDFLVDGKIVLEIKVANQVYKNYFTQVLQYLKSNNLKLGIIGVFTPQGILVKRVINQIANQRNPRNLRIRDY